MPAVTGVLLCVQDVRALTLVLNSSKLFVGSNSSHPICWSCGHGGAGDCSDINSVQRLQKVISFVNSAVYLAHMCGR